MASLVVGTFPQTEDFWQSLKQSFDVLRSSKWRHSSWMFSLSVRRCFSAVSHPQQYSIATMDTVVPINIEVRTKYPLSHNDKTVVLKIRLHSQSPMLCRPALHGNWSALSLARRALKDKFITPKVPLTVCYQIVRYFCRTLFIYILLFRHATIKDQVRSRLSTWDLWWTE